MILDTLENIELYKSLSKNLYDGLSFLKSATTGISIGVHDINSDVYAIVSEYPTVAEFERGYEAHRHVIDIQYPIRGLERVKWSPLGEMKINIEYDEQKDRTFYKSPSLLGTEVIIGDGIFAIMFPNDAHSPQHFVGKSELIKKITVKIRI